MLGRWIIAVFLALFLSITVSASALPPPPPPPPGGVIKFLRSIIGQADHGVSSLPHSVTDSELPALRGRVDGMAHELATVPRTLPAEELAALREAIAAHLRYQVAVEHLEIPQSAGLLVFTVRSPRMPPEYASAWVQLRNRLKTHAEDYIKQYACEKAWESLTPDKKQELKPPPTKYFTDASEETVKTYVNTVFKFWESTLVGQYVAWDNYGTELFEKMEQFVSQGHLVAPPQAYFYYARYCLTPPIP
ncbi:hypothetical protein ACFVZ4_13125 [Streptomyces goshikiensis]|uniref:hypothetical protein n=1 Tax=Streptomyces goshikiensis TaxID=1942 RepID=UPI0036D013E7